jgi:phage shock protein C
MTKRLYRSRTDSVVAGVCGGLAEYFGWDPTLVRVGYVLLSVLSAAFPGLLVYVICWIVIPTRKR